jgi:hypothetical protein
MRCGCSSLRSRVLLPAVAIGLPLVEALVLGVVGESSAQALAPQASAPAPFAVFHDLRWLLVFHSSWLAFAIELLALLVVRSAVTAVLVWAAWPTATPMPGARRLVGGSVLFTVMSAVVLAPFATLMVGMAVVSLSWLFFVAIPSVLFVAVLVHHGAVVPAWWRERPPSRTIGWILLSFVVLTLASAAIVLVPWPLRLPAVAATGVFNAWAWHGIVHALSCAEPSRRLMPVAPLGIAALVGVIALGSSVGFSLATRDGERVLVAAGGADEALGRPVMWVAGFGSEYEGPTQGRTGAPVPGLTGLGEVPDEGRDDLPVERRFSYAGTGPDGEPLPYRDLATYQDLGRSVALLAHQVEDFHADAGEPITVVAESEGALVAKAYLMSHPDAPVDALVLLSPLVEPGAAYYPPAGEDGWGVAGGWNLGWVSGFIRAVSPLDVSTGDGLFRSLLDNAPTLRGMLACPIAGVDQLALFPLADAVAAPEPELNGMRSAVVPAFHGGLADEGGVRRTIRAVLDDGTTPGLGVWDATATLISAGVTAWRAPTLPLSLNPVWEGDDDPATCADIGASIAAWVP